MSEPLTEDKTETIDLDTLLTCLRKHGVTKFARQGFIVELGPAPGEASAPTQSTVVAPAYMRGFSK